MAIPTRLNSALAGVQRLPVTGIFDSGDTNPVFYIKDDTSLLNVGLGINFSALLDANGKVSTTNWMAAAAITEAMIVSQVSSNAKNMVRQGKWTYDYAVNGGAVDNVGGTIVMTGDTLPVNAVVIGGVMDVTTIVAGAGATAAIQLQSANDIISAAALSGAPWSSTGLKAIVPVFTAATYKKVATTAKTPSIIVTSDMLTAGVFTLTLFYVISDAA